MVMNKSHVFPRFKEEKGLCGITNVTTPSLSQGVGDAAITLCGCVSVRVCVSVCVSVFVRVFHVSPVQLIIQLK